MRNREKKSLDCDQCGRLVENVGDDAVKIICHKCVEFNLMNFENGIEFINDEEDVQDNFTESE